LPDIIAMIKSRRQMSGACGTHGRQGEKCRIGEDLKKISRLEDTMIKICDGRVWVALCWPETGAGGGLL